MNITNANKKQKVTPGGAHGPGPARPRLEDEGRGSVKDLAAASNYTLLSLL